MNMHTNLAHEPPIPQPATGEVVQFPQSKRRPMSDQLSKGFIMKSRLYHYEVEPFLSNAAKNVYSAIMGYINGFNKPSDHISHRQIQGGKLKGSKKLSSGTVTSGIKELIWFEVISVVEENNKLGNKYQINEVSLVECFEQLDASLIEVMRTTNRSASISEALRLVVQSASTSGAEGASTSGASIDILYRYSYIKDIKSLRSQKPLDVNFWVFQKLKKQQQLEQEKREAAKKQKAEAERKEKSRKLSFDEVMQLTTEKFETLCDLELWEQYVSARSQLSKTKLTKNALNTIYKDFKDWGYYGANQSLKTSITGNYQGLFEPKYSSNDSYQHGSAEDDFQFGDLAQAAMRGGYCDV